VPLLCRAYNIQFKYYLNQAKAHITADFYHKYKHTATLKWNVYFVLFTFFLANIPTLISYLIVPFPADPLNVTQCFSYFTWIMVAQGTPMSFGLNFLFVRYLKLKDPYMMKREFGVQFATGLALFGTWLAIQIYDTATGGVHFPIDFQPMYLMTLFCFNVTLCNLVYPVYLAYKESKLDLGMENLSTHSGSKRKGVEEITIKTILENDTLFEAFKETTIQYWCVESLLFLAAVERYRSKEDSERDKEAKKIFNVFFQEESQLFININDAESKRVAKEIQLGRFPVDLFDSCYHDVHSQLEGILIRWKTTAEFKNLIFTADERKSSSSVAQFQLAEILQ